MSPKLARSRPRGGKRSLGAISSELAAGLHREGRPTSSGPFAAVKVRIALASRPFRHCASLISRLSRRVFRDFLEMQICFPLCSDAHSPSMRWARRRGKCARLRFSWSLRSAWRVVPI